MKIEQLYSRAHSVELLPRGGEPQVLVVGDHFERVRAARHGLRPALPRVEGPRYRHQEQDEEGCNGYNNEIVSKVAQYHLGWVDTTKQKMKQVTPCANFGKGEL